MTKSTNYRPINLRGLNFADFADLGKIAKLSPGEKFATGPSAIKSSRKKKKEK